MASKNQPKALRPFVLAMKPTRIAKPIHPKTSPIEFVPLPLFDFVLRLRRLNRLPLHIRRRVSSAPFQRYHVIDDIAGTHPRRTTSTWARMGVLKRCPRLSAPLNAAVAVALNIGWCAGLLRCANLRR